MSQTQLQGPPNVGLTQSKTNEITASPPHADKLVEISPSSPHTDLERNAARVPLPAINRAGFPQFPSIHPPCAAMPLAFAPGIGLPLSRPSAGAARPRAYARRAPLCAASGPSSQEAAAAALDADAGGGVAVGFGGLAPGARKAAAVAAAVVAGFAGMAGMPERAGSAAKPIAAGVCGVTAAVTVSGLSRGKGKAARKALAKAVAGAGTLDAPEVRVFVEGMEKRYGLEKSERKEAVSAMFELFFLDKVKTRELRYEDVADLVRLKQGLVMDGGAVGDSCYEVARAFYRNNVLFLDAEDDDSAREDAQAKMDKLFFLCDRLYHDKDTEEAATYEVSRVCNFFAIPTSEFDMRVERVALPFYRDVIVRACKDATVDKLDVEAAQAALGVSDSAATTVRLDAYADAVAYLVESKGKLEKDDTEELTRLRGMLSIPEDRATVTLKTLADPVYRMEVNKALDAAAAKSDSMASIYGRLALRESELGMPADAARSALASQSSARAIDITKRASKYLRVQNIASCISVVKELLEYADTVVELVSVGMDGPAKEDAASLLKTYAGGIPESLTKTEPRSMYRLYLSDVLKNRNVSAAEEEQLKRLRALLGLSEVDAQDAFKAAAGPVYRKTVVAALADNKFDDATKANKDKVIAELALPAETWKSINLDLYKDRLEKLVDGNRIIQEHEAQTLFTVRQFLDLNDEDVAGAHKYAFGPVYEQSISEAMGATGIMLDEYRQGLEKLRTRFTLSKDDADAAFYRVVKRRMQMYVNRAMVQLEKRQNLRGGAEERDVGDDPNIRRAGATLGIEAGGLPIELSNLVDFYVRNNLIIEEKVPETAEEAVASAVAAASSGDAAVDKEVEKNASDGPAMKTIQKYPVTLKGMVEPKVYNELYKQYVIQCFSAQTRGEKQRLFASLDQLGPIMGMTEDEVSAVHSQIGTVIYQNYVNQTLLKGPIGDSDMDFLNNIQKMLSMKEETCKKLLKDGRENRVSVLAERIFSSAKVLPESVRKMRAVADELGVDIVKDLKISVDQRKRLFGVEVDEAIDTGAVTGDNQDLLKQVQAGLQVPDKEAKEILLSCIQRRTLSHLVQASASLRQNRSEGVVAELRTMLRYGKLLPAKVIAPAVSDSEKQEMFLLFQADAITDGAVNEESNKSLKLLQTLLGFSDSQLEAYT